MTRAALPLALLVAAAGCGMPAVGARDAAPRRPSADGAWHYDVTLSEDVSRMDVRLTFAGPAPPRVILGVEDGLPFLSDVAVSSGATPRPLALSGTAFELDGTGPDATIRYRVDLAGLADHRHGPRVTARIGRDLTATPGLFLLRPHYLPKEPHATLTLHLPPGAEASVPWPRAADGSYTLDETTFRWRGFAVFGPMEKHEVSAAGCVFDVAILDYPHAMTWPGIERWTSGAAAAVGDLYGGFPVPRAQLAIKPVPSNEAVPFGETQRGGGFATVLHIGDEAADAGTADDWVAVHEFTHLGMPAIDDADAWFSEGFVQYYTETLRGRAGLIDEQAAWLRLVEGFARGRREGPHGGTGRTLAEESASMHSTHSWFRVYWGGAAIAMFLDVELRRSSGGAKSLDDAMREVHRAFAGRPREATAQEIVAHLDAWLGRPLFSEVSSRHLASKDFPPVDESLARLGVAVSGRRVTFDDAAPDAAIRRAIMTRAGR